MLLEKYLKKNSTNIRQMHLFSGVPESTLRELNKRDFSKWNVSYIDVIAKFLSKNRNMVINELETLTQEQENELLVSFGKYNLENRRYIGNKNKLLNWINELIDEHTQGDSFFDVFAGTGVVSRKMLKNYHSFIINDFLYSNNVIYNAFFGNETYDVNKLLDLKKEYELIDSRVFDDDYFSVNYGGKFFSIYDAEIIGEIRTRIANNVNITQREKDILIASLIYSSDKIANTVGHYDAYRKKVDLLNKFKFDLINPLNVCDKQIKIFRKDANELVRNVYADIAFIDPPYNSRQYSRFYHVLENIAKWDKPPLSGVAMKPPVENMSEYSRNTAPAVFDDLIKHIQAKYIVVTYNNTYKSKSSSSMNKISHEEILDSLNSVGKTKVFEMPFQFFNAGKTSLPDHKEYLFITNIK